MRFPALLLTFPRAARTAAISAASVGVSVPLQFLADTHLARAVWQHNARFAVEIR